MCESATHVVTYRMHDAKRVASISIRWILIVIQNLRWTGELVQAGRGQTASLRRILELTLPSTYHETTIQIYIGALTSCNLG